MKTFYLSVLLLFCGGSIVLSQSLSKSGDNSALKKLKAEMKEQTLKEIEDRFVNPLKSREKKNAGNKENNGGGANNRISSLSSTQFVSSINSSEFNALLAIYNNTAGANWTDNSGWVGSGSPVDVSNWAGITVDASGHVIGLDLSNNNLTGTIPASIDDLVYLKTLNLDGNNLTGVIPVDFGNMTGLNHLILSNNNLTGGIPTQLGNMTGLLNLNISNNQNLGGSIPGSLGNLTQLQTLLLTYSNLQNTIPSNLRLLTNLQHLYLTGNNLSGSIFSQINQMSSLRLVQLGDNNLSGTIPSNLFQVPNLEELYIYENGFNGSLSSNTPAFTSLKYFVAYAAGLTGAIPDWFAGQYNLSVFNIAYNGFSGTLPENLMGSGWGKTEFRVNNNPSLSGKLSNNLKNITGLLDISNCSFTFSSFIHVIKGFGGSSMVYAPQMKVDVTKSFSVREGFRHTFEAEIDRIITRPNVEFKWFRLVNGNEVELEPASVRTPYRYQTSYLTTNDFGVYYYKIFHPDAPDLTLQSQNQTLNKSTASLGSVSFDPYDVYCGVAFDPIPNLVEGCSPIAYEWTFGDGATSVEKTPIHVYSSNGTYSVTLKIYFKCGDTITFELTSTSSVNFQASTVSESDLYEQVISTNTVKSEEVLSASIQTYSSNWSRNFSEDQINDLNSFVNGKSGNWGAYSTYFFDAERSTSTDPDLEKDGTFDLNGFSYRHPEFGVVPGWIEVEKTTSINQDGLADESVDALGIFTSNLYGYSGGNVIASVANAKRDEILNTDFEDISSSVIGNWRLSQNSNYKVFSAPIVGLNRFVAVIDIPLDQINEFNSVSLIAPMDIEGSLPNFSDTPIICKQVHPTDPSKTIIVIPIGNLPELIKQLYTTALFKVNLSTPQSLIFDAAFAHTGQRSMKIINATESITQDLLKLGEGKEYTLSAWISNGVSSANPIGDPNQYIEVIMENQAGVSLSSQKIYPELNSIDMWQRVVGNFQVPAGTKRIKVKFSKGSSSSMWVDDIRILPSDAVMKSYVYEVESLRVSAILDEENFSTTYHYDKEGNLRLLKRETESGIVTITEVEKYLKTN